MDEFNNYCSLVPCELAGCSYDYDFSHVHTYSDLGIQQTDLSVRARYQVNDNLSLGCGVAYLRYDDDEPYLYDGTGEAYITNVSVSYFF